MSTFQVSDSQSDNNMWPLVPLLVAVIGLGAFGYRCWHNSTYKEVGRFEYSLVHDKLEMMPELCSIVDNYMVDGVMSEWEYRKILKIESSVLEDNYKRKLLKDVRKWKNGQTYWESEGYFK